MICVTHYLGYMLLLMKYIKRTGLKFLSSGNYVVKNALSPIYIDIEKDEGIYYEPNIWIEHSIND